MQISAPTPPVISGTSTPPSINIQGSNPAIIHVGDTYTDLGAIVTDNQGHDLGYKTFLNGTLVSNIVIDTSQVATDTIDYVATDTWATPQQAPGQLLSTQPPLPRQFNKQVLRQLTRLDTSCGGVRQDYHTHVARYGRV
ncbi:MAG TPA: hypothetical protein VFC44_07570 [Candidatus Saccharimonadales bacterium]|nr:hypothetical protein [Candidatus Saccharimonadales bacterium]